MSEYVYTRSNIECLEEESQLDINNVFQLRYDIQNIILSSDELKKSEAVAEGFALMLSKIDLLKRLKDDATSKNIKIKNECDAAILTAEQLKREVAYIKDQHEFVTKENCELKDFIARNQNKIILFDNIQIDAHSMEIINDKLKFELNRSREMYEDRIKELTSIYEEKIGDLRTTLDETNSHWSSIVEDKDNEIERLKALIRSIRNLGKVSKSVACSADNSVIKSKNEQSIYNANNRNQTGVMNMPTDATSNFSRNFYYTRDNRDTLVDQPSTLTGVTKSNEILINRNEEPNRIENEGGNIGYQKLQRQDIKSNKDINDPFTLRQGRQDYISNQEVRLASNNNQETITNKTIQSNYSKKESGKKDNFRHKNENKGNDEILIRNSDQVVAEDRNISSSTLTHHIESVSENLASNNLSRKPSHLNSQIQSNTLTQQESEVHVDLSMYNIEEISKKIKASEIRIKELNQEFESLDIPSGDSLKSSHTNSLNFKDKFAKANNLMELIEHETNHLLNLKSLFNQIYKNIVADNERDF